jgi:NAD kinase
VPSNRVVRRARVGPIGRGDSRPRKIIRSILAACNLPKPDGRDIELKTWDDDEERQSLLALIDFVVVLGGDGTILWANRLFPTSSLYIAIRNFL